MNGIVKWLFMFVFGFIAAFTFMFYVSGSIEPSTNIYEKRDISLENNPTTAYGLEASETNKRIWIRGTFEREGALYVSFDIKKDNVYETRPIKINIRTENNKPVADKALNISIVVNFFEGSTQTRQVGIGVAYRPGEKGRLSKYGEVQFKEKETRANVYILVSNISSGTDINCTIWGYMLVPEVAEGSNMLTWFTNVVNTTRQQSFWDFVKEPVQRFIDKMAYFDGLEKPSFVEVLEAIWNVFLLILSPIEIIGRALWWLALVLYDLIPLLLNPTWT